jgi:hypothetical protein
VRLFGLTITKEKLGDRDEPLDEAVGDEATANPNTPEQNEAVQKVKEWFTGDENAKDFYVQEMKEMYKLYIGDHWDLLVNDEQLRSCENQKTRPNCVENITFAFIESIVSEFAKPVEHTFEPTEEGDEQNAIALGELVGFVKEKNRFNQEQRRFLWYLFTYGTGILFSPWDPDWRGGKGPNKWEGDIRVMALHPNTVTPDARARVSVQECRRVHRNWWQTLESVEEDFERGSYVHEQMMDDDALIGDEDDSAERRAEQARIIETWYVGKPLLLEGDEKDEGEGLHVIWWSEDGVYLKHTNYIYGDPGEPQRIPFIFCQRYPRENSLWGFGECYQLKNPQIMKNKTAEVIIEGIMHQSFGQTFYTPTAFGSEKQKAIIKEYGTMPGMYFEVQNLDAMKRIYGQGVPAQVFQQDERLTAVMEAIVARPDISQGRLEGGVTAASAIQQLMNRANARLTAIGEAIGATYEDLGKEIEDRIVQFYSETRRYRIRGKGDQLQLGAPPNEQVSKFQFGQFRNDQLKKVHIMATGQTVPLDQFNPEMLTRFGEGGEAVPPVEGEDYEVYSPDFDSKVKVSAELPGDKAFFMTLAKELMEMQVTGPETLLYVIEHGTFPPIEQLRQQVIAAQQAAMAQPPPPQVVM